MDRTDCEVCKKLIREKHQNMIWWKVCCIVFGALAIILGILYFGSGSVVTETQITVDNNSIATGGDNGTIIIGGEQNAITGTLEETDYTPIICITVIAGVAILVAGGVLIANYAKKDD